MLIFLQNRIIQQSSKWHSPTGLGLHIKWLGNMNPGLQKLSLTRVLRLHSTLQDQANIWLALVLIHSTAFHPYKWEQFSKGSSKSSKEQKPPVKELLKNTRSSYNRMVSSVQKEPLLSKELLSAGYPYIYAASDLQILLSTMLTCFQAR